MDRETERIKIMWVFRLIDAIYSIGDKLNALDAGLVTGTSMTAWILTVIISTIFSRR